MLGIQAIKEQLEKEGYTVLEPNQKAIIWSVEDFEAMAIEREGDNWEKVYDKTKFPDALHNMIRKHDAEYGITWESIKCYLYDCLRDEED